LNKTNPRDVLSSTNLIGTVWKLNASACGKKKAFKYFLILQNIFKNTCFILYLFIYLFIYLLTWVLFNDDIISSDLDYTGSFEVLAKYLKKLLGKSVGSENVNECLSAPIWSYGMCIVMSLCKTVFV
jgi:hypothetical protein